MVSDIVIGYSQSLSSKNGEEIEKYNNKRSLIQLTMGKFTV